MKPTFIEVLSANNGSWGKRDRSFLWAAPNVLEAVRKHDMLILCGNMNPAVGASNLNRVGIMGAHETGNISDNDGKLVEFCEMNSFVITVTIFPHKEMLKTQKKNDGHPPMTDITIRLIIFSLTSSPGSLSHSVIPGLFGVYMDAYDQHPVWNTINLKLKRTNPPPNSRTRSEESKLQIQAVRNVCSVMLGNEFAVPKVTDENASY